MGNMSLTVGAEDKTKTVSCYANNLALSETKVKVSFETLTKHYWTSLQVETHTITVLSPPGAPSITGYRSGELVSCSLFAHTFNWLLMICAQRSARAICAA